MTTTGRPSSYTQEIADTVCQRIAEGESLRTMCRDDDEMPSERTVYRWLNANEAFCQQYACARKTWADAQIEEIIAVSKDVDLKADDKRVQIDTLKWAMGKLNGKYSDKVKHVGGDDGDNPIAFTGFKRQFID